MKSQTEVFTHFIAFCAEVKTQFSDSVRILRSDNAKVYMSKLFQSYMRKLGILISLHVLIHLPKMELLRGRIDIYLRQLEHFCSN